MLNTAQYGIRAGMKCACCGHTAKESRLSQSQFVGQACGYTANADVSTTLGTETLHCFVIPC
ncbi:hypothetical protein [Photorhabdus sp. SF281]|uniref:hypothetical protein n=1 Tax=Photorhabdus sp. SF281 TaxID=3459527 RepID=UPI0040445246